MNNTALHLGPCVATVSTKQEAHTRSNNSIEILNYSIQMSLLCKFKAKLVGEESTVNEFVTMLGIIVVK